MKTLITGGAGFIGLHLCRELLRRGHDVRILDNLNPQIHADPDSAIPDDLRGSIDLWVGDVRNRDDWSKALAGRKLVIHLAAETGTGQSMYEAGRYCDVNVTGTSLLYELLASGKAPEVGRVIVASSRAVYGEGAYHCPKCGSTHPEQREIADLREGRFEARCPACRTFCEAIPTPETAPAKPASLYALTKHNQEQMAVLYSKALGIPTVALRFQNVFGPGQSLTNPYTGILAIFSNLARSESPINVFEDGQESRDFVYIDDVVDAIARSTEVVSTRPLVLNVGGGERITVHRVVKEITAFFGSRSPVRITGEFRAGDIRHNMADLDLAKSVLGYEPRVDFSTGVKRFLDWASRQPVARLDYEKSLGDMKSRGLIQSSTRQDQES